MPQWYSVWFLFAVVCAQSSSDNEVEETCLAINCVGQEYQCINGNCYCADGYLFNQYQTRCVRCPDLGEKCFGPCCNKYGNGTLQCWQGICQQCYDSRGKWICRESIEQILLISSTQVVMGAALILGVIATFALLYKLCGTPNLRPLGGANGDGRLSIGSLQMYVDQRLRDAPPRCQACVKQRRREFGLRYQRTYKPMKM